MSNPILLGKAETEFYLETLRLELTKHLQRINRVLPDTYTSVTLICRTDKEAQQIVLSNKMDVEGDITALKTMKRD